LPPPTTYSSLPDPDTIHLLRLPGGEVGLRSVFKDGDGSPRFVLPLPENEIESDPGLSYLVINECRGGCEYQTRRFLDAHLEPDDLFIDVGAHWGLFTLTAASCHPGKVAVLAIEADPHNTDRLRRSIAHNQLTGQVEVLPCAVGAKAGTANLVGGLGTMGHSLEGAAYTPDLQPPTTPPSHVVPVQTLDQILADRPALADKRVFLKVDVEGSEVDVLEGARALLASGRVAAMVIEKGKTYQADPALSAFGAMLDRVRAQGFQCFHFKGHQQPGPLLPYELSNQDCDVVCLSSRLKPLPHYE